MFDTIITDDNYREDLVARLLTIKENLEDGVTPAKVCRMIQEQVDEITEKHKLK